MATLLQLQMRRQELEEKLQAGDLAAESALEQIDRAIASRTLQIQRSRERLAAVKQAVAAGVDKDQARRINKRPAKKNLAEIRAKRLLNRF